jgi:flavin reductase (DIM6/NTAB) family NADH-FMN oxidoreductase RutF
MHTINIQQLPVPERMHYLQSAIAPRPICLASTIDKAGNVNLSPFSFFNLFSAAPPILIFSPSRKGRDGTLKHTLENILEVPEVVVNIVTYNIVQQISLSSCEFAKGVNEFDKAGFTMQTSTQIKPPRVQESLIQLECKVQEVKSLGNNGGAGQLVIAEIVCMHVNNSILDGNKKIDAAKLDLVARLGGDYYARINPENIFTVPKPNTNIGIGIDQLPVSIRTSSILTGNHLGMLGNSNAIPDIDAAFNDDMVKTIVQYYSNNPVDMEKELHSYAAGLLDKGNVAAAWQVLLTV